MAAKLLSSYEVQQTIKSFLHHPDRVEKGASSEEIIKVINWVQDLKIQMLINKTILKELYLGNLFLDVNQDGEVVMSYNKENEDLLEQQNAENFLVGDIDDYLEDYDGPRMGNSSPQRQN